MPTELREAVAALGEAIACRIGEPRYKLWFHGHTRFRRQGEELVVGVPNRHFEEWLGKTFHDAVADAAAEVYGESLTVRFHIDPELFQAARKAGGRLSRERTGNSTAPVWGTAGLFDESSAENTIKVASAQSASARIAASKGPERTRRYAADGLRRRAVQPRRPRLGAERRRGARRGGQPAGLHGPVGTGKTHLLEGIYAGLRERTGLAASCYVTAEDFTNRFVQAMRLEQAGRVPQAVPRLRRAAAGRPAFPGDARRRRRRSSCTPSTRCIADGRQMVVTCDCHPRLADDFTPGAGRPPARRGGVGPDAARRRDAAGDPARRSRAPAARRCRDEVLKFLAAQLRGNVRELEGAREQRAALRPRDRPADRRGRWCARRWPTCCATRSAWCSWRTWTGRSARVLRLSPATLQGKGRAWAVSHPRMVAMYLAPQAHGGVLQRHRQPLRRAQPQHGRRRREEGAAVAGEERGTVAGRAAGARARAGGAGRARSAALVVVLSA